MRARGHADLLGALRERLVSGRQPGEVVAHRGEDALALEVAVVVEEEVDDELRLLDEDAERADLFPQGAERGSLWWRAIAGHVQQLGKCS